MEPEHPGTDDLDGFILDWMDQGCWKEWVNKDIKIDVLYNRCFLNISWTDAKNREEEASKDQKSLTQETMRMMENPIWLLQDSSEDKLKCVTLRNDNWGICFFSSSSNLFSKMFLFVAVKSCKKRKVNVFVLEMSLNALVISITQKPRDTLSKRTFFQQRRLNCQMSDSLTWKTTPSTSSTDSFIQLCRWPAITIQPSSSYK